MNFENAMNTLKNQQNQKSHSVYINIFGIN